MASAIFLRCTFAACRHAARRPHRRRPRQRFARTGQLTGRLLCLNRLEVVDPITSHDNAHILVIIVMSSLASAPLHLPFGLDCAEILILPAYASQTEMCNRCGGTARDQCRSRA